MSERLGRVPDASVARGQLKHVLKQVLKHLLQHMLKQMVKQVLKQIVQAKRHLVQAPGLSKRPFCLTPYPVLPYPRPLDR